MGNPANVPKLRENHAAFGMYRVRHLAPSLNLRLAVDTRRPGVPFAARLDLGAFGNDEPGASALPIISGHLRRGDIAGLAAALASERRHDNPVFQDTGTQCYCFKE